MYHAVDRMNMSSSIKHLPNLRSTELGCECACRLRLSTPPSSFNITHPERSILVFEPKSSVDPWEWGRLGSHGFHGIPMGMGIRSAMGWEWDENVNEVHENGN